MGFHSTREALVALGVGGVLMSAFLALFWLALLVPAIATWVVVTEVAALLLITVLSRFRRRRPRSIQKPSSETWI